MKTFRKSLCIFLTVILFFSLSAPVFAENSEQTNKTVSSIYLGVSCSGEVKTFATQSVDVEFSNETKNPIYNVTVQAFFDEVTPVKKKESITSQSIDCLEPGEKIEFRYYIILNPSAHDVGFFNKIAFFFVKLFKGAYTAESIETNENNLITKETSAETSFGKFTATNTVIATYSEASSKNENPDNNTTKEAVTETTTIKMETTVEPAVTLPAPIEHTTSATTTTATTTEAYTAHTTREASTTRYTTTYPRTTTSHYTTTESSNHTNPDSKEAIAYTNYIDFVRSNSSSISKCDAADINDDGIFDLIVADYNGKAAVLTYNYQYGIYELYSKQMGKGNNMPVYYSTLNQVVVFPSASTGGAEHITVYFDGYNTEVTDELISNNKKTENEGCFLNGEKISEQEYNSIVDGFPNRYMVVEGTPNQLISVLQEYI